MATRPKLDEVDRAAAAVGRGIARLVTLLGDDDRAVIDRAAMALGGLGAAAVVGPLAAALPRAPSPKHRLAIMGVLFGIGTQERVAVTRALTDAVKRKRDPHVQAAARAALAGLFFSDIAPTA